MGRNVGWWLLGWTVSWWLLGSWVVFLPTSAEAVDACRAACRVTRKTCFQAAASTFVATKAGCPTTRPDRAACLKAARLARAAARLACRNDLKTCKAACPPVGGGGGSTTQCGSSGGIAGLNEYRQLAGLPAVTERADLSAGDEQHSIYMVKNDEITHVEDPGNQFYTAEGAAAGLNSNVAAFSSPSKGLKDVVDYLMASPFHGVGFIDPALLESGAGIAHDTAGSIQTAGAVDVLSGRGAVPAGVTYPILFPADGTTLPLTQYPGNELPDPLTSCPGFAAPTGMPLFVQLATTPAVTDHALTRSGTALEHCIFDGTNYTNPDAGNQSLGRAVLAARNAIVIFPRAVLSPGTYTVSVTTGGQTITWSFTVTCNRKAPGF